MPFWRRCRDKRWIEDVWKRTLGVANAKGLYLTKIELGIRMEGVNVVGTSIDVCGNVWWEVWEVMVEEKRRDGRSQAS